MEKLLQTLTEARGPSGYEDEVREIVRKEVDSLADDTRVDALGNLIVWKRSGKAAKNVKRVMIAVHMDEMGLMVSHVDGNGFIRFSSIGSVPKRYLLGARVRFLNDIPGLVGASLADHPDDELPTLDKFYIDVGARNRSDCPVKVGDIAVFDYPYTELGNRLVAKSLDNRVGVWVAVEALRNLKSVPYEVIFVFTTQQRVNARGASTSAYGIEADIGIALDVTPADDAPHSSGAEISLGKGPCIKLQDAGMIADTRVVDWMIRAAEKHKIPYQRAVLLAGTTEARTIQQTRTGVPAGCISVPVRYTHSPSEMADASDMQQSAKLLAALLHTQIEL